jgi:two-component system chemotaxis response regulator CheB
MDEAARRSPGAKDGPIRVLIVDDSAMVRVLLRRHLSAERDIAVVGTAADGCEALSMVRRLDPDVITLDVTMPCMDGLSALKEIMRERPRPVIMLSSLTGEGAEETVAALSLGALDFVTKPADPGGMQEMTGELVGKIRRVMEARPALRPAMPDGLIQDQPGKAKVRPLAPKEAVVLIGASTGGPGALRRVMARIPAGLPAAGVIVQHMPSGFTRALAGRLSEESPFLVREATQGEALAVGKWLVAPGGWHLTFDEQGRAVLDQSSLVHGVRPAIDVTLSSLARVFGSRLVAVILTGMGTDGTLGAQLVHAAGGRVIVEDRSTCVVWGMPRSIEEAGIADAVLGLEDIAAAIARATSSFPGEIFDEKESDGRERTS